MVEKFFICHNLHLQKEGRCSILCAPQVCAYFHCSARSTLHSTPSTKYTVYSFSSLDCALQVFSLLLCRIYLFFYDYGFSEVNVDLTTSLVSVKHILLE